MQQGFFPLCSIGADYATRMPTTYQQRLQIAIDRVGGQAALARRVSAIIGRVIKPQTIQYLADDKRAKPAQGSGMTAAIAKASGLRAEWIEYGEEPMANAIASLDATLQSLVLTAVGKLAAPGLDEDVKNSAISALRLVAKQDIAPYGGAPDEDKWTA